MDQKPRRGKNKLVQRKEEKLFSEVVALRRVTKVTAGAKRMRFSVVVIAGDKRGRVGIALGKGADPQEAIQRATRKASNTFLNVQLTPDTKTLAHRVEASYKSASVLIKPAPQGTGVVAGGAIRKVLEIAGVENVVAKRMGSSNPLTNAYCAIVALSKLKEVKHAGKPAQVSTK